MISVYFIKLIKKGCGLCRYVQSLLDAKLLLTSTETLEPSSAISLNLKYTNKRTKFKIAGTVQKETPQVIIMEYFYCIYPSFITKARCSQQGRGARAKNYFAPPPLNIFRGARKMCIILNHEKTILPIQVFFGVNFYIFSLGQVFVEKNLKFLFQGQILLFGGQFSAWGNLKSLFYGQILLWGAFFNLGKFVYGKS